MAKKLPKKLKFHNWKVLKKWVLNFPKLVLLPPYVAMCPNFFKIKLMKLAIHNMDSREKILLSLLWLARIASRKSGESFSTYLTWSCISNHSKVLLALKQRPDKCRFIISLRKLTIDVASDSGRGVGQRFKKGVWAI